MFEVIRANLFLAAVLGWMFGWCHELCIAYQDVESLACEKEIGAAEMCLGKSYMEMLLHAAPQIWSMPVEHLADYMQNEVYCLARQVVFVMRELIRTRRVSDACVVCVPKGVINTH